MIDSTEAKIGRLMKNLENTQGPLLRLAATPRAAAKHAVVALGAMPTALRGHGNPPCPRKAVGMAPETPGPTWPSLFPNALKLSVVAAWPARSGATPVSARPG